MDIKKNGFDFQLKSFAALKYLFMLFLMLYAWHQSHFQFEEYWDKPYKDIFKYISIVSIVVLLGFSFFEKYNENILNKLFWFVFMISFYAILSYLYYGESLMQAFKSIIILLSVAYLFNSNDRLYSFVRLSFFWGVTLIILNSVTILHWLNYIELPSEIISRVGGEVSRPDLNPISFNMFGRTESYAVAGTTVPRLQGWSSEPLHWAYFVLMTLSYGFLLQSISSRRATKVMLKITFGFIIFYSYFIASTTLFICLFYIVLCWVSVYYISVLLKIDKHKKTIAYFLLVIIPGLAVPFALAGVSNAEVLFSSDVMFGEKSNWGSKLGFLNEGLSLFTHFIPSYFTYQPVSHNYILDEYLRYGYLLIIPILLFLFSYINLVVLANKSIGFAVIIFIVTITLANPNELFSPSGVIWCAAIFATYHYNIKACHNEKT